VKLRRELLGVLNSTRAGLREGFVSGRMQSSILSDAIRNGVVGGGSGGRLMRESGHAQ
jgi:hypothetical protein